MFRHIIILFLLISCNYQAEDKFFAGGSSSIQPSQPLPPPPKEVDETDTDLDEKSFEETFQNYLNRYVVVVNKSKFDTRVDYKAINNDIKSGNQEYLTLTSEIENYFGSSEYDKLSIDEKIAYLINAYNYFTIKVIAENYPLKSITDLGGFAIFDRKLFNFKGEAVSLNYLEKTVLVNILKDKHNGKIDARFHFAVICGAKGCPILHNKSYSAKELDEQLDFITKAAFQLSDNRILKRSTNPYELVELFQWYEADFTNHSANGVSANNIHDFINLFLPSNQRLRKNIKTSIPQDYDWTLNEI